MHPSQLTKLGKITTPYGSKTEQEPTHPGVDIANHKGTPIPALADGVIHQTITGRPDGEQSFGNSVMLKDKNGLTHRYSHLNDVIVKPGQRVKKGMPIATMGSSGAAYSPSGGDASNLDLRVVNAYGKFIDPTGMLPR